VCVLPFLRFIIFLFFVGCVTVSAQQTNTIVVGGGVGITSVTSDSIKVKNPGYSFHFFADIPITKFLFYTASIHYWSVERTAVHNFPTSGNLRNFEFTLLALKAKFPVLNFRPLMYGGISFNQLLNGWNEQTARLAFDYGFGVEYHFTQKFIVRANIHNQAITSGISFNRPVTDRARSVSFSLNIATILD